MNNLNFEFGNAVMHFQKTGGGKGFLWKFAGIYALLALVVQGVGIFFMAPVYAVMFNPSYIGDEAAMEQAMLQNMGGMMLGYLLMLVLGLLMWMLFEGASQRRYLRGEGFRLQLGADEWRLLVVALIWVGLFIGLYIGMFLAMIIPGVIGFALGDSGAIIGVLLMFVAVIAYMIFALWLAARFSPSAALTVRDQKIQFAEAWRVTRGKAWTIVGAWLVLMLIMFAIIMVLYIVFSVVLVATLMPAMQGAAGDDPDEIFRMFMSPGVLIPVGLFGLVYLAINGAMVHVFGGPAALAAKTDPNWADHEAINQTFI